VYIDKSLNARDLFVFEARVDDINPAISTGISMLPAAICHQLRFSQLANYGGYLLQIQHLHNLTILASHESRKVDTCTDSLAICSVTIPNYIVPAC